MIPLPPTSIKNFKVQPLTSDVGAKIEGVDLARELNDDLFNEIYQAFLHYQVLIFSDQDIPPERQLEFGRRFGEPQVHVLNQFHDRRFPELYVLSNLDEKGQPDGRHPDPGTLYWHTDGSWTKRRTIATMLYSIETPRQGGETQFANMYRAYDALTGSMKKRLDALEAVHHLNFHKQRRDPTPLTAEQVRSAPPVRHAVVRHHPETGQQTIYLGDMAESIVDLNREEGRALIERLNDFITRSEFVFSHKWSPREFVVWDNRCTLHRSTPYDTGTERRVMRRLTVLDKELQS
ncbi:MAG: TauD/TfdA family dioxygenase [Planctomycetaceae bacterium]